MAVVILRRTCLVRVFNREAEKKHQINIVVLIVLIITPLILRAGNSTGITRNIMHKVWVVAIGIIPE